MRKIINSTYITLDGVIANPQNWPSGRVSDDGGMALQTELLSSCDGLLMGRHTYNAFAAVWPTRSGDPYSARINSMAKYVVSSTLQKADWTNTRILTGDHVEAIRRLKQESGRDIVQYGFGELSYSLLHHGLLDELRLWVHPFFYGSSGPEGLLYRPGPTTLLNLAGTKSLKNGDVILTYTRS